MLQMAGVWTTAQRRVNLDASSTWIGSSALIKILQMRASTGPKLWISWMYSGLTFSDRLGSMAFAGGGAQRLTEFFPAFWLCCF